MNYYLKVLQNYAVFNGRARRSEYWWFFLINMVIGYGLIILAGITEMAFLSMSGGLYMLATLLPGIGVAIRRMHDVGKSGWFILIPIYNLILAFTEGDKGPNEYGEDPKANM